MITRGSVRFPNTLPAAGYTVQVWDEDFFSDQLIGQVLSDVNGNYSITHRQSTDAWGGRGDFYVKVLSSGNQELFRSPVHNNFASSVLVVNAVIDPFVQNNWSLSYPGVPGMQSVWGNSSTNVFIAGGTYLPFGVRDTRKILRLNGSTWPVVMTGAENLLYHGIAGSGTTIFAVGRFTWSYDLSFSAIFKSADNGGTWTPAQNLPRGGLTDVWTPDGNLAIAVGEQGLILKTTDAGATWNQIASPVANAHYYGVWGGSAARIFIVGWSSAGGVILRSTDGGNTWTQLAPGVASASFNGVRGTSVNDVFVVGAGGTIIQTTDGGATWTQHQLGVNSSPITLTAVWTSTPTNAYVVGYFFNGYTPFGVIFHFDGSGWKDHCGYVWSPPRGFSLVPTLTDVWGTGDGRNIFAVGPDGLARRTI